MLVNCRKVPAAFGIQSTQRHDSLPKPILDIVKFSGKRDSKICVYGCVFYVALLGGLTKCPGVRRVTNALKETAGQLASKVMVT